MITTTRQSEGRDRGVGGDEVGMIVATQGMGKVREKSISEREVRFREGNYTNERGSARRVYVRKSSADQHESVTFG